jgi:hypothetical protein
VCSARSSIIAWWHADLCDYYGTQDWKPAVIANWKLWVPFQFINFLAVPQPLQVAFANIVALAWNIYLSFASHTEVYTAAQTSPVEIEMSAPGDQKD